ncbi:sensor histidine kinase [Arthrobacter bambusae]|uniref:sensor histidine kinase n=1 Tax=Arthrobacter sp. NPDC058127 TaxID=3346351 RepID=UPI0036E095F8
MKTTTALDEVTAINGVITDQQPVDFHSLGLAGCIDRLAAPLRRQGTEIHWETPHHGVEISSDSASLLYHAAKEVLSNAFKYAHAHDITVRLAAVYHGIRLTVTDNGAGFDSEATPTGAHHGFGLRLMSIAVSEVGGEVSIVSSPGNGTCVTVTLPLD